MNNFDDERPVFLEAGTSETLEYPTPSVVRSARFYILTEISAWGNISRDGLVDVLCKDYSINHLQASSVIMDLLGEEQIEAYQDQTRHDKEWRLRWAS